MRFLTSCSSGNCWLTRGLALANSGGGGVSTPTSMSKMKVDPRPGSLVTPMVPPISSTKRCTYRSVWLLKMDPYALVTGWLGNG